MNNQNVKTNFETNDLSIASYIHSNKVPLLGIRQLGQKVYFQFENPEAENFAIDFINDGKVSAKALLDSFKELKRLIYAREL